MIKNLFKLFCWLGFHDYWLAPWHCNHTSLISNERQIRLFGWFEFRVCEHCEKIQQRKISVAYGYHVGEWKNLDEEGEKAKNYYFHELDSHNKKVLEEWKKQKEQSMSTVTPTKDVK